MGPRPTSRHSHQQPWTFTTGAAGLESAGVSADGYPRISNCGHPPTPLLPTRTLQIGRWGNVLALRLPQALSQLLHLQQGDRLQLQLLSSGELLLTPRTRRSRFALADQLERRLGDHSGPKP